MSREDQMQAKFERKIAMHRQYHGNKFMTESFLDLNESFDGEYEGEDGDGPLKRKYTGRRLGGAKVHQSMGRFGIRKRFSIPDLDVEMFVNEDGNEIRVHTSYWINTVRRGWMNVGAAGRKVKMGKNLDAFTARIREDDVVKAEIRTAIYINEAHRETVCEPVALPKSTS
jgi:hypothetical protein